MKNFYTLFLFVLCLAKTSLVAQNVNISTKINGFRHNWDCCNDGASVFCIGSNFPDLRFKVWIGYNGTTFSQSTNGPGLYCGASDYTYGADAEDCSTWNPGEITGPAFSNVAATSVNVDMQSWEDDGCGSNCVPDGPSSNPFDACFYNADDTRCGRLRIGDIDFSVYAPCSDQTYNGAFTGGTFLSMHNRCGDNNGAGYGLDQFKINWNFAAAPTIVTQPSAPAYGGAVRDVCTGLPITLTVICNKFVPGIRPGAPTAEYVATILSRTTFFGAVFFSIIAVMPFILQRMTGNALFAIGGTAILIAVSVSTDLIKKLSAQASMKEY
jgi:hypothetical protein